LENRALEGEILMASSTQTYTIATDFPSGKVNSDRLIREIRLSAIVTALDYVNVGGGEVTVKFKADLPASDKTILDGDTTDPCGGIIGAHSGEPLPEPETSDGVPLVHLDGPSEVTDRKPVVVISPATEGWLTFITSCGDNPSPTPPDTGRGTGDQILIETLATNPDNHLYSKEVELIEPIELHDGQVTWNPVENFGPEDRFSLMAAIPATPVSAGGAQNCNLVDVGGFNLIVPATPGTGTHEVNAADVAPVPTNDNNGYWAVEYNTGAVSVSPTPGQDRYQAYDAALRIYFIKNVTMSHPLGVFDIDVYKTEYFHQKWKVRFEVFKKSTADGMVTGWIFMFRRVVA
jgi:hypothetical protein